MKNSIMTLALLIASTSQAANVPSNDFSRSSNEIKQIGFEELTYRLHVTGEIFLVSGDGEKLVNIANETREWEFSGEPTMNSNWFYQAKGQPAVAIAQEWKIENDGKIIVKIRQYDSMERAKDGGVTYGKLVKETDHVLKDFSPIETTITSGANKLVVRLTPGVWIQEQTIDVGALPISGRNIVIYDSRGNVWADGVEGDSPSTYFGASTYQGSLYISFVPFKGAKLLGAAKFGRIKLKTERGDVFLQSEMPFVPRGTKVNVYGIVKFDQKTERARSVRTYSSNKEENFIERIPGK